MFTSKGVSWGPNITAFHSNILFSPGAPDTPAGGSSCNHTNIYRERGVLLQPYNYSYIGGSFCNHTNLCVGIPSGNHTTICVESPSATMLLFVCREGSFCNLTNIHIVEPPETIQIYVILKGSSCDHKNICIEGHPGTGAYESICVGGVGAHLTHVSAKIFLCPSLGNIVPPLKNPFFEKNIDTFLTM